jgi:hypothetical protein
MNNAMGHAKFNSGALVLYEHLYLSEGWWVVDLITHTKNTCAERESGSRALNL